MGADAWLCWVESAKSAPTQGGFPATDGEPVPCPRCGVDMRWLEADVERLAVACSCGVVVTEHYLVNHCGGRRFRARRSEPDLADWLAVQRRRVLLGAQRDQHAKAVEAAVNRVLPAGVTYTARLLDGESRTAAIQGLPFEAVPAHGRTSEVYAEALRAADEGMERLILGDPETWEGDPEEDR
ncbi:hypothetical protein [Sorangium sp. So ce388]|uniref:hypothetical protein n=1 Tax=Sorangium sp. So ce388 TaxID=3133309 RepID=UPI003F5AF423